MSEAEFREQLEQVDAQLSDLYRQRREIQAEFSAAFPPVLPPPRFRTDAQAKIARCPRCGGSLSDIDGAKK